MGGLSDMKGNPNFDGNGEAFFACLLFVWFFLLFFFGEISIGLWDRRRIAFVEEVIEVVGLSEK